MNKFLKDAVIIFTLVAVLFISASFAALAQNDDYKVLAPLPGIADKPGDTTNINKYIPGIFNFAIGLSAIFVVVMIVYGGVQYLTTDAFTGKQEGKSRIFNAIKALVLVIGAWLILYEINPKLVDIDLSIESIKAPALSTVTAGKPMTQAEIDASNLIRKQLEENGVKTYAGPCINGETRGCVNLNGLPDVAKNGAIALHKDCKCNTIITGGTEDGHQTHGVDKPMLDFSFRYNPDMVNFVEKNAIGEPVMTSLGPRYTLEINGKKTLFLKESNHWHVVFTNEPMEQ
jgi:hypothetical protein